LPTRVLSYIVVRPSGQIMCTYTRPSCKLACIVRPVSAAVSNNSDHSGSTGIPRRSKSSLVLRTSSSETGNHSPGFWCMESMVHMLNPPWHAIARLLMMASSQIILMVALLFAQSGTCSLLSDGVGGSLSERPRGF
jgi:hypothetical protein